jgi:hypothetical protein
MYPIKKLFTGGLIIFVLLSLVSAFEKTPSLTEKEGWGKIMAFRKLTLLPNTDTTELEQFASEQLTPTFKQVPGVESYIIKGQRGDHKEQYVHLLIFDSQRTRDFYFPFEHSGESEIKEEALSLWRPGQIILLDSLPKYTEPLQEESGYTDYIFIE